MATISDELAAPERLAAVLAEAPPDVGFADELRQMREEDAETARDARTSVKPRSRSSEQR